MPGRVPEPQSSVVAQFSTPLRGTWNSAAVHAIPQDALFDSMNVFVRRGKLRNRPGLSLLNTTVFDGPVLGAAMAVTPTEKRMIAITQQSVYELGPFDDEWTLSAIPNTTLDEFAPDDNAIVDIAFMQTSGDYFGLIAEEHHRLRKWDSNLHAVTPITAAAGSAAIPQAKSVCIADRRVIALVSPHTVRWSKIFTIDNFDPNAYNIVAQTNDVGICVKSLSSLSFVLYKERSIYTVRAQGGDDSTAFNFNQPIYVEGPAGVHAVVNTNRGHVYMTRSGRVALYDGAQYPQWIADGLWLFLQDDIDPHYSRKIFGVHDYRLHTVTFYYPRRGDGGLMTGMVLINMPYEGMDIADSNAVPNSYKGVSAIPCSYGCEMRFDETIDRSLLFSSVVNDCQSFTSDETVQTDDGAPYECSFQTPLVAMPQGKHAQVTVELFLERSDKYGAVTLEAITSNGLESAEGTLKENRPQIINLDTDPVREYHAFNVMTRFFGLRVRWDSSSTVRYAGAVVYGHFVL